MDVKNTKNQNYDIRIAKLEDKIDDLAKKMDLLFEAYGYHQRVITMLANLIGTKELPKKDPAVDIWVGSALYKQR